MATIKFCNDTQLYYKWVVRGYEYKVGEHVYVEGGEQNFYLWTEGEECPPEFYDEDEAQQYYHKMLEEGEGWDSYELEQQWYEDEDETDCVDCDTIEGDLSSNASELAKNLYNYGINEATGEPLTE
tara:strand:+ start:519 stop:896 length:378 start_codon:yes stop_codon:yes gene_type:complete